MNKEEKKIIKRIEDTFNSNTEKVTLYEEGIADILKLLNFVEKQEKELEQKSETLDKVTDKLKETVKKERQLMPYLPHKSVSFHYANGREVLAKEILNILEGENNNGNV